MSSPDDITNFCPCCVELTRENEALRAEVQALWTELAEAFPLLNEEGLSEIEHHCEWSIQQDRKRLHKILKEQADD